MPLPLAPDTGLAYESADRPAAPFEGVPQPQIAGFGGPVEHFGVEEGEDVVVLGPNSPEATEPEAEAPVEPVAPAK